MMLNIKDLASKGTPVPVTGTLDLTGILASREDVEVLGKLEYELTAQSVGGLTRVEGTLRLPLRMPCSRCLQPVEEPLIVSFLEQFASTAEAVPEEDRDEVNVTSEDHIKLDPYMEEAVWLALPLAPLCKETCEGLCPECGADRNSQACSCRQEKIDPRLAGLADFFKRNES